MLPTFEFVPLTDHQVQAGARPGESWDQARERLWYESEARAWHEQETIKARYYDLKGELFQMVYGMGPIDPRALAVLRERLREALSEAVGLGLLNANGYEPV